MAQQGQVFPLARTDRYGTRWAYRYRIGGRDSRRVQRGGFESEQAAAEALERVLEQLRREQGLVESPTLGEFVEAYLAQHDGEPETTAKLRWLLRKAVCTFGDRRLSELRSPAIAAWRMTIPSGHRFEVDPGAPAGARPRGQLGIARRQPGQARSRESSASLHREATLPVVGGVVRARRQARPSLWTDGALRRRDRAAAGEWLALEHRDIDREARVAYVRRTLRNGRIKTPKTKASLRAVPVQAVALRALEELRRPDPECPLLFPAVRGGHIDLHNFRNRIWKPAQRAAGITPLRRVYDLRHTFATFALRAGISTFDLSRRMGTSLAMIDRHYGHLARDGREHAIRLLDSYRAAEALDVHAVDARWTLSEASDLSPDNGRAAEQAKPEAL
jgi:integrase